MRILPAIFFLASAAPLAAQEHELIDYAGLFKEHAADVVPGVDYWGRPGEVLNLPDGTTLWRGGTVDVPLYNGTSTVGTACDFYWALIAIDPILRCPEDVPPDQLAAVNRTVDQILTYWGQNAYPSRSLAEMRALAQPDQADVEPLDCEAIKADADGPLSRAELITGDEYQAALRQELSKPPHLMVMDPCY